jgi:hypothetical protein
MDHVALELCANDVRYAILRSTYQKSFGYSYHNEFVRWHCVAASCPSVDLRNPSRVQPTRSECDTQPLKSTFPTTVGA